MTDGRTNGLSALVCKGTEVIGFSIGDACNTRYTTTRFFVGEKIKSNSLSHIQKQNREKN